MGQERVNQHLPAHHEGWMVCGWVTLSHCMRVPIATITVVNYVLTIHMYLVPMSKSPIIKNWRPKPSHGRQKKESPKKGQKMHYPQEPKKRPTYLPSTYVLGTYLVVTKCLSSYIVTTDIHSTYLWYLPPHRFWVKPVTISHNWVITGFPNGCCTGGHWRPQWTSTHECTIHWIPVMIQLCMILNWVTTRLHLGNPFYKK